MTIAPLEYDTAPILRELASMPPDTVVSHRCAASLWGLWVPCFGGTEVTTPATWRGSEYTTSVQRQDVIAHRRLLDAGDVTEHHGLPVTTVLRTWLDLAPVLDLPDLVAAGDSALRTGMDLSAALARVAAMSRTRGLNALRAAGPLLDGRSRSRPESRIRAALVLSGLPRPEVNSAIADEHGGWLAEPDLVYREARVALEYNGADHATVQRMRKDSVRLLDLQRAGWEVRTFTAVHAYRRLDDVVAEVRQLLRRRCPQLLVRNPRTTSRRRGRLTA